MTKTKILPSMKGMNKKGKEVNKLKQDKKVAYLLKCFRETGNVKFLKRAKKMHKEADDAGNTERRFQLHCQTQQ